MLSFQCAERKQMEGDEDRNEEHGEQRQRIHIDDVWRVVGEQMQEPFRGDETCEDRNDEVCKTNYVRPNNECTSIGCAAIER